MQVRESIERRVAHEKQVHEVSVVGYQGRPLPFGVGPRRVVDGYAQHPPRAGDADGRSGVERLIQARAVRGVHTIPPSPPAQEGEGEHHGGHAHRHLRTKSTSPVRQDAGLEPAFLHRGADQRHRPDEKESGQREEGCAERLVERKTAGGGGQDRHQRGARSRRAPRMKRKAATGRRAAPSGLSSARRRVATAMTGTSAVPDPAAPSTVTCTLYEPPLINQRAALYRVESPGTCWATSGGGGAAVWGSQYTGSTRDRKSTRL